MITTYPTLPLPALVTDQAGIFLYFFSFPLLFRTRTTPRNDNWQ
jgi:hypothetical protein